MTVTSDKNACCRACAFGHPYECERPERTRRAPILDPELVETVSAAVHDGWMDTKHSQGITTRKLETGEELMVPYDELSEPAKDLDRGTVRSVLTALTAAGYRVVAGDEVTA